MCSLDISKVVGVGYGIQEGQWWWVQDVSLFEDGLLPPTSGRFTTRQMSMMPGFAVFTGLCHKRVQVMGFWLRTEEEV